MRAGKLWHALLTVAIALGMAAPADGATQIGSNLTAAPFNTIANPGTFANQKLTSATTAVGGMVAPAPGVITTWAIRTNGNIGLTTTMRLVVIAGNTGIAKGPAVQALGEKDVISFPARIPIGAGQRIGIDVGSTDGIDANIFLPIAYKQGAAGSIINYWNPVLAAGESRTPMTAPMFLDTDTELDLQATIEPDADGDGFGDETQDDCVGTAGSDHGCVPAVTPPPTSPLRPDTQITGGPTKTKKPKATFTFTSESAGASFECAVDKGGFLPCTSPTKLKHLARGNHTFSVRAISAEGLVDASPAEQAFTVKRRKHKPK